MDSNTHISENFNFVDTIYTTVIDTLKHNVIVTNSKLDESIGDTILENTVTIIIALIAGLVALYQVKSNIVSSARIKWIEDLRQATSELYEAALSSTLFYQQHKTLTNDSEAKKSYDNYLASHSRFFILANMIKMQINTKEKAHKKLYDTITEVAALLSNLSSEDITQDEVQRHLDEIVKTSREIFKKEWDKSKKLFKI